MIARCLGFCLVTYSLFTNEDGPWAYRLGLAFVAGAIAWQVHADVWQIEQARQAGYDDGYSDGCEVARPKVIGLADVRSSIFRSTKQLGEQSDVGGGTDRVG